MPRALTADEESALRDLAALDAVSAIQWGSANNDTDVMSRGYRTLARLRPAAPGPRGVGSPRQPPMTTREQGQSS